MAAWARVGRTFARRYSSATNAETDHAGKGALLWKRITYFVAFPAIGLAMFNSYLNHQAHHNDPRPEFIPYEHMRRRTKPFPWGDGNHTLFHNPKKNALPNGYEE
ncbi:PREDICTED: cytochrome c oxidase subunit 6A2, mitochondrial-like [Dinoponera quadriceps]|uniref:Cytochrome c oxidase subunit 6A2, mitochondrial-like n=1 Tax=Dinoponera quadriceps TaxID=609295 RepID=A0A6P3Y6N8_DINQU|nr:PREDICTED: cytochrome c oxidase subunit 6A2, mitochondrial-like [Dinoponera quadriceps]